MCPELLNIEAPEAIQNVHRAYVEAGSNIVETNTFGASRIKLNEYNLGDKVEAINIAAVKNAVGGVSGIIFQFPLYAGIMGMIKYSGLVSILADSIVAISTPFTFGLWTFISSALINMFVPSGGGQWAVQGPIAVQSAAVMNADIIKTALAVGYGNTWTNMFQPFWAIALLGVTGLKAKDIMGYTTAIMLMSGPIFILAVLFL